MLKLYIKPHFTAKKKTLLSVLTFFFLSVYTFFVYIFSCKFAEPSSFQIKKKL